MIKKDGGVGSLGAKPSEAAQFTPAISQLTPLEVRNDGPSLIGEDLAVTGNIVSKGEVHVEGEIQGNIDCASLIVGEKALINGSIVADDVIIRGRVEGIVRSTRLSLQASCHVEADIIHKSLVIEQGAYFEGKSRRADDSDIGASSAKSDKSSSNSGSQFSSKSTSTSADE